MIQTFKNIMKSKSTTASNNLPIMDNAAEEDWNLIEEVFQSTAKQLLPPKPRDKKHKWMTNTILETNEETKVYQKQELKRVQDSKPKDTL